MYTRQTIKRRIFQAVFLSVLVSLNLSFLLPVSAAPGVPTILAYQGRLKSSSGALLGGAGTTYYFKFSLWDAASVGSGSRLWPASAPTNTSANVIQGVFNVNIGDTASGYPDALDYNFADNQDIYLQVEIATSAGGTYETIGPRQRVTASGFAINAKTVGGFVPSQIASGSNIPVLSSGNLTLGGTNPQINATSSNNLVIQGGAGTGNVILATNGGRVGVGTASPDYALDIVSTNSALYQSVYGTDDGLVFYAPFDETSGLKSFDHSPLGSDITWSSTAVHTTGKYGNATTFASGGGVYGGVTLASPITFNDFSAEFWINSNSSSCSSICLLFGWNQFGGWSNTFRVFKGSTITFNIRDTAPNDAVLTSNGTFTDGIWHHVALVRTGASMFIYKDGVLDASTTSALIGTNTFGLSSFGIGGRTSSEVNANLDELRIYKRALSQDEIKTQYLRGRTNNVVEGMLRVLDASSTTEFLRVTSAGSVGIGTTAPSSTLHVVGTSQFSATSTFSGNVGIGTATPDEMLTLGNGGKLKFIDSSATYGSTIYNNGYTFTIAGASPNSVASLDILDMITMSTGYSMRGVDNAFKFNKSINAAHNGSYGFETYGSTPGYAAISSVFTDSNTNGLAINSRTGGVDTERIRIESGGNVGIGITDPDYRLDIIHSPGANTFRLGANTTDYLYADAGGAESHIYSAGNRPFKLGANSVTDQFVLAGSGNVGVGTTTPAYKLDVYGNARFGNQYNNLVAGVNCCGTAFVGSQTGGWGFGITSDGGTTFPMAMDGPTNFNFNSGDVYFDNANNRVGIGTTSPSSSLHVIGDLTAANGVGDQFNVRANSNGYGYSHTYLNGQTQALALYANPQSTSYVVNGITYSTSSSGLISDSDSALALGAGGAEAMRITTAGNVGIGTTAPSALFQSGQTIISDTDAVLSDPAIIASSKYSTAVSGSTPKSVLTLLRTGTGDPTWTYSNIAEFRLSSPTGNGQPRLDLAINNGPTMINVMSLNYAGNVGIGTTAPGAKLNVVGGTDFQNILLSNVTTDATVKYAGVVSTAYTSANRPVGMVLGYNNDSSNLVDIGGGQAGINAATNIRFWTAANNNTNIGTERMSLNNTGALAVDGDTFNVDATNNRVGIGTTAPSSTLHVVSASTEVARFEKTSAASGVGITVYRNGTQKGAVGTGDFVSLTGTDTDFGIYSPGSAIFTAGGTTERMRISSTGLVGIGTSTPDNALTVRGSSATRISVDTGLTNGDSSLILRQQGADKAYLEYIGTTFGGARQNTLEFYTIAGVDQTFLTGSTEKMRILSSNGNVGIGTASPSSTLHVVGDARVTGTIYVADTNSYLAQGRLRLNSSTGAIVENIASQDGSKLTVQTSAGGVNKDIVFAPGEAELLRLTQTGRVGVGITTPSSTLHLKASSGSSSTLRLERPSGSWGLEINAADNNGDIYFDSLVSNAGSGNLIFRTNPGGSAMVEQMRLTGAGNVGIGTSVPSSTLHVVGTTQLATTTLAANLNFGTADLKISQDGSDLFIANNNINRSIVFRTDIGGSDDQQLMSIGYNGGNGVQFNSTYGLSVGLGGLTSDGTMLKVSGYSGVNILTRDNDGNYPSALKINPFHSSGGGRIGVVDESPDFQLEVATSSGSGYFGITNGTGADGGVFTVNSSGKVGIGTAVPSSTLHVVGNIQSSGQVLMANGTSTAPAYSFASNADTGMFLRISGGYPNLAFATLGSEIMRMDQNGSVGIGTTAPTERLSVAKTDSATSTIVDILSTYRGSSQNPAAGWGTGILFKGDSQAGAPFDMARVAAVWETPGCCTREAGLAFYTNKTGTFTEKMRIDNNGNVGIGTSTPSSLFTVATSTSIMTVASDGSVVVGVPTGGAKGYGTINAQAVYDDNTLLTDFVFDKYYDGSVLPEDADLHGEYKMLTIDQMMDFNRTNRHLPTITGREEWNKQGGLSLGKLASQFWESIETQALYIGELNSRIKALELSASSTAPLQGSFQSSAQLPVSDLTVTSLKVTGNLIVQGFATFNADTVGQAEIAPSAMTVRVTFSQSYKNIPIVTVTPVGASALNGNFRYVVNNQDKTGFNIDISSTQALPILFNWHAFASADDAKIFVVDGQPRLVNISIEIAPVQPETTNPIVVNTESSSTTTESVQGGQVAGVTTEQGGESASSTPATTDTASSSPETASSTETIEAPVASSSDSGVITETTPIESVASTPEVITETTPTQ